MKWLKLIMKVKSLWKDREDIQKELRVKADKLREKAKKLKMIAKEMDKEV